MLGAAALALATALILPMLVKALYLSALCSVSHFCACIGSPCLRQCVHGASIGGDDGGGAAARVLVLPARRQGAPPPFTVRPEDEMRRNVGEPQPLMTWF
eukprot:COSAG01_NODE_1134_length_11558_cov_8.381360_11_plen_100_part_00